MPDARRERLLESKVALVTGAGRGIGRSIALAFAKQGAGLSLVARTQSAVEETAGEARRGGGEALAVAGDVSRHSEVERFVSQTLTTFGRLDILVNNAGVQTPIGPLWQQDPDEWLQSIQVNLGGVFLCCRAIIPAMIAQGAGKIINLSGAGGGALPYFSAYSASKAAVVRLTETLAGELQGHNIQINAIAPGAVRTSMTDDVLRAGAGAGATQLREAHRIDAESPTPAKASELAVFLASAASGAISGRLISAVWDDWPSLPQRAEQVMASDLYTLRRVTN